VLGRSPPAAQTQVVRQFFHAHKKLIVLFSKRLTTLQGRSKKLWKKPSLQKLLLLGSFFWFNYAFGTQGRITPLAIASIRSKIRLGRKIRPSYAVFMFRLCPLPFFFVVEPLFLSGKNASGKA
jgi:hypothetical protein